MVTVDIVVFREVGELELLVIRRKKQPFLGQLALPGGFVDMDEDLLDAAKRELGEETSLKGVPLEQLAAFGKPGRDPRGRNISIVHVGILTDLSQVVKGGDDAEDAQWIAARNPPRLAFDHLDILAKALEWFDSRGESK